MLPGKCENEENKKEEVKRENKSSRMKTTRPMKFKFRTYTIAGDA